MPEWVQPDKTETHRRVSRLMEQNDGMTKAPKALMTKGVAPDNADTLAVIYQQDIQEPPEGEAADLAEAMRECRKLAQNLPAVPRKLVREVVEGLDCGAALGTSPWSARLLKIIVERRGGLEALSKWCDLVGRGQWQPRVARFFTQVVMAPIVLGEKESNPGGLKLRDLGLGCHLWKLAHQVTCRLEGRRMRNELNPVQVCFEPEGCQVVVSVLSAWARDATTQDGYLPAHGCDYDADPFVIIKTDLAAAYGSALRSRALRGLMKRNARMAVHQAGEWRLPTWAWIKQGGKWTQHKVERGVGQGVTLSQYSFTASMAEAVDSFPREERESEAGGEKQTPGGEEEGAALAVILPSFQAEHQPATRAAGREWIPTRTTPVAIADDLHLAARALVLLKDMDQIQRALAEQGFVNNTAKEGVWCPAADLIDGDAQLPWRVRKLCTGRRREKGGMQAFGISHGRRTRPVDRSGGTDGSETQGAGGGDGGLRPSHRGVWEDCRG